MTMIILAVYYTVADLILLGQIFLYGDGSQVDPVHLNPANPMSENVFDEFAHDVLGEDVESSIGSQSVSRSPKKKSHLKSFIEFSLVALVVIAGVIGWYISYDPNDKSEGPDLTYDPLAQSFGWLSAALYLGSRMPQILLNYKRKSCEGVSFLFFLCACLGNLTYVISILSISISPAYLWVQSSWLAGSIGTLALDFVIFVQFFLYNEDGAESDGESTTEEVPRFPLLT